MPATTITHIATEFDSNDPAGAGGLTDTLIIAKPTGTVDGHVMIAGFYMNSTDVVVQPGGWTQIGTNLDDGTNNLRTNMWYKVASSEGSSYTWTVTGTQIWGGCISTFSGVDTTSPVHQNAKATTTSGTDPLAGPNVTTTIESFIYTFQGTRINDTVERTSTSSDTELADFGFDGGVTCRNGHAYFRTTKASPGTIAGASIDMSATSNITSRGQWTLALTPANPTDPDSGTGTESTGSIVGTVSGANAADTNTSVTEGASVSVPIGPSAETGTGTEGASPTVDMVTEYLIHDNFDRDNEDPLNVSTSGHDWTSA